jgi:hypothetical protein
MSTLTVQLRRRLTIWIVVLCALLLAGCSEVLNEYYISNHTDGDLTVRITPLYIETVHPSSGPLIQEIRKSARASLSKPVSFDQEGDTNQFTLPAKTTVYLGFSSGGMELFRGLEVISGDRHLVMDGDDYKEHFTVRDNFVGAVVHVLDVR